MFWQALEALHCWERENLPTAGTPQGAEILVWLLKYGREPRPLGDLYQSSRFSEPTVRACLKAFVAHGFVTIDPNGADTRERFARATPKLEAVVNEYCARFKEVSAHLPPLGGSTSNSGQQIEPAGPPAMTAAIGQGNR